MKNRRSLLALSLVGGATIAATMFATVPVHAAAPANGCPAGYELLSVSVLTSEGYNVPALVDSPTSGVLSHGKPGNGDGWVCGVQLGNRTTHFGLPFYNFIDDTLPAS